MVPIEDVDEFGGQGVDDDDDGSGSSVDRNHEESDEEECSEFDNEEDDVEIDDDVNSELGGAMLTYTAKKTKRKADSNSRRPLVDWSIVVTGLSRDECDNDSFFQTHRFKCGVKGGGSHAKVCQCRVHEKCSHLVKMQLEVGSLTKYTIFQANTHSAAIATTKGKGLHVGG